MVSLFRVWKKQNGPDCWYGNHKTTGELMEKKKILEIIVLSVSVWLSQVSIDVQNKAKIKANICFDHIL